MNWYRAGATGRFRSSTTIEMLSREYNTPTPGMLETVDEKEHDSEDFHATGGMNMMSTIKHADTTMGATLKKSPTITLFCKSILDIHV